MMPRKTQNHEQIIEFSPIYHIFKNKYIRTQLPQVISKENRKKKRTKKDDYLDAIPK